MMAGAEDENEILAACRGGVPTSRARGAPAPVRHAQKARTEPAAESPREASRSELAEVGSWHKPVPRLAAVPQQPGLKLAGRGRRRAREGRRALRQPRGRARLGRGSTLASTPTRSPREHRCGLPGRLLAPGLPREHHRAVGDGRTTCCWPSSRSCSWSSHLRPGAAQHRRRRPAFCSI